MADTDYCQLSAEIEKTKFKMIENKIKIIRIVLSRIVRLYNKKLNLLTDFKFISVKSFEEKFEQIKEIVTGNTSDIEKEFKCEIGKLNKYTDIIKLLKKLLREINYKLTIDKKDFIFVRMR